jgi:hypothetical protein
LVERCREFAKPLLTPPVNGFYAGEWSRLGIAESINVEGQRG